MGTITVFYTSPCLYNYEAAMAPTMLNIQIQLSILNVKHLPIPDFAPS